MSENEDLFRRRIRRALISVYDKTGLVRLAQGLHAVEDASRSARHQDHVHELKLDVKNLGSTIYHTLYEQQHIRQIIQRQNKGVKSISKRTVFAGLLETIIICMSSILQVYFVRQLFKSKNIPTYV